ncbi:MAG: FtsX-like permease family protein, partial [Pseudomonadota bacterium]
MIKGGDPLIKSGNQTWRLAWWLASRAFRQGVRGFRIFAIVILLGVATIAAVLSLASMVDHSIQNSGRDLLGGDLALSATHQSPDPAMRSWIEANSFMTSEVRTLRTLASHKAKRALVHLKAVDASYPLTGALILDPAITLSEALARDASGRFGLVLSANALQALGIGTDKTNEEVAPTGHIIRIGDLEFIHRATILSEPDRTVNITGFRPRIIVSEQALIASGLDRPGSLIRNHMRVVLQADAPAEFGPATIAPQALEGWVDDFNQAFPGHGFNIRDHRQAAPALSEFLMRIQTFLSLAGLTALIVGGLGVVNAVQAHLNREQNRIALLRCIGATGQLTMRSYGLHIAIMAGLAIAGGLVIGMVLPLLIGEVVASLLKVELVYRFGWQAMALSAAFGILSVILFAWPPIARLQRLKPAMLFQPASHHTGTMGGAGLKVLITSSILAFILIGLAFLATSDPKITAGFIAGVLGGLAVLYGLTLLVVKGLNHLEFRHPIMRIGVGNLGRTGASTKLAIMSLGVGLSTLACNLLVERNLAQLIEQAVNQDAPSHYFIDIQEDQLDRFHAILDGFDAVRESESVPMLRGRITHMEGVPVEQLTVPDEFEWMLRGDRGVTWLREPPARGSTIVEGVWWDSDHQGPPELSFDIDAAKAFGLGIGDTITVQVLGRSLTAPISNLRQIEWEGFGLNFVLIFSPGLLENAPQTYIATSYLDQPIEQVIEDALWAEMPNITPIRVSLVMGRIFEILEALAGAMMVIAALAIMIGALVLAGSLAASQEKRIYDATLLKVLGWKRSRILASFMVELAAIALISASTAAVIAG